MEGTMPTADVNTLAHSALRIWEKGDAIELADAVGKAIRGSGIFNRLDVRKLFGPVIRAAKKLAPDYRPEVPGCVSDEHLAEGLLRSPAWRNWVEEANLSPASRNHQLPDFIRSQLKTFPWLDRKGKLELTVQRVARLIRSRWAIKAAETRKKNAPRRREKKLAEAQLPLL